MVLHAPPGAALLVVTMVSPLLVPLRALVIGALGAGIAWCWFNDLRWVSIVAPLVVAFVGILISEIGVRQLPQHPVAAVLLLPWRALIPSAIAALAAGVVIVVTVALTLPDTTAAGTPTPEDLKAIVSALSTAITAFLAAAFIDWASDGDDSRVADWIKDTFEARYKGRFASKSQGWLLVFSNYEPVQGWSGAARMKRAKGIAAELASRESDPPASSG